MKQHLTGKKLQGAINEARAKLGDPKNLNDQVMWSYYHQEAQLEFPLGELSNPNIAGFVWAWKMQARIETTEIAKDDRFNANGLEGKIIIRTTLSTALIAAGELPEHRSAIKLS